MTVNLLQRRLVRNFNRLFKQLHHETYEDFRDTKNQILGLFSLEEIINPPLDMIDELVNKHGFDPNITTENDGWNLLMFVCVWQPSFWSNGYETLIQRLVHLGLDLKHHDTQGRDLSWYCKEHKCDKFLQFCE